MKIAVVYWTYNKDYEYLILTLSAIPRLKNKYPNTVIDVYVFDDWNNPCIKKFPNFVNYKKTTFNRRGNLNGLECIINIINEYKELSKNYDWVIKCDCDTYINNLDVIVSTDYTEYGLVGTLNAWGVPLGCSVAYSRYAIDFIYNSNLFYSSYKILKVKPKERICDDFIFNSMIMKNFKWKNIPVKYTEPSNALPGTYPGTLLLYNSNIHHFKTFDLKYETYLKHWSISFKNMFVPGRPKLNEFRIKFGLEKLRMFLRKVK